jgi:hypothetical protein
MLAPVLAALIVSLVAPLALPLTARADDDAAAVASTGVARLSLIEGTVAIQRGDSNTTVDAVVNAPVLAADYVTTGPQSRAEVQFDGTTVVRLAENVQVRLSHIDAGNRQLQLAAGTIDLRLLRGTDGSSAIDTPSISIVPRATGSYRVTVDDQGNTFVTVRSGHADIQTPQGTHDLDPGTTLVAQGPASNPQISTRDAVAVDSFDTFNQTRDRDEIAALTNDPYVNNAIDGVADLGAYGQWTDDGSYGQVWIPANVAPGWAPYRNGNWVWEDSYGWTWVAAEPWGWAPYHYGRWYFSTAYHRWAWYPPARNAYVAWSPALVGFVGLSIGAVNVGIGFGNVGWVPLAPYEAFHPWWGPHATYINNTTTVNNTYNVTHVYRNAMYNGVSSVSVENFRAGRFGGATAVSAQQLAYVHPVPMHGALPIVPTTSNLRFSAQANVAYASHAAFVNRTFAGTASVTQRTPFAEQQASVARVTHTASYNGAPASAAADPWSRFNAYHGTSYAVRAPASAVHTDTAASYGHGETGTYAHGDTAPAYGHNDTTSYARAATSSYARPATSTYNRPETTYSRPASYGAPAYAHPSYGGGYAPHDAAPAHTAPAPASRGGESHGGESRGGESRGGESHGHENR